MKRSGIAQKLSATYFAIILTTILSGVLCFIIFKESHILNDDIKYNTIPSIENLKVLKNDINNLRKQANAIVFMPQEKPKSKMTKIIGIEIFEVTSYIQKNSPNWNNSEEERNLKQIAVNDSILIDSINHLNSLFQSYKDYFNDSVTDIAVSIYSNTIEKIAQENDKLLLHLIAGRENDLEKQESGGSAMINILFAVVFFCVLIVALVSYFSFRYSKKYVIDPLSELRNIIINVSKGEVAPLNETKRNDEIGEMHNAISKMLNSIIDKINFSEQIGMGHYDNNFRLLSNHDKLGKALLTMRNNLKKTNAELIEKEHRLIEAQEIARVGNYLYNYKTHTFECSQVLQEIFGIDQNFPKTKESWNELILPEFRESVFSLAEKSIKEKRRYETQYIIKRNNDNQERWINIIGENKFDIDGSADYIIGTVQDITDRKTLELELEHAYKISTEQNKRLLNFSYIVSHNLRMHAVNIHSLLEMYQEAITEDEKSELIQLLVKASDMLDETLIHLNEVVAMQNSLKVAVTPLCLYDHIGNAIDVLKLRIEEKCATIINNVSSDIIVNYNPAYLDSIILNLVSNAIKYGHPDRKPTVTIDCYREGANNEHDRWVLQVSDNGVGIDMAKHGSKLFGMYKTFHGNKDAKGIGLFLTKYQIEAMGGEIDVYSELNVGTTFKVYIK